MASEALRIPEPIRFGEDFELEAESYTLRRSGRVLKLERIPMEILLFVIEQRGQLVRRDQIVERVWGKDVFLDTDNSINGAIRKIRQILKDDPENPQFIQTVTGRGYRFIAPITEVRPRTESQPGNTASGLSKVEEAEHKAAEQSSLPTLEAPPNARRDRSFAPWKRLVWFAIAAVLVAGVTLYFLSPFSGNRQAISGRRVMLAVLPFENLTGDTGQEYFSDGMTEEMITDLGRFDPQRLGVIARTSVMHYKNPQIALNQIGRELGVEYVIEGSIRRDVDRVRITAQLIRVKDQTHVWAKQYDRELSHLLVVQGEIAQDIANEIEPVLGGPKPLGQLRPATTTSYEAYDLYLKGRFFWNKRSKAGFQQAAEYFQQAIGKDANYARAYAGLADTYGLMSIYLLVPQNEFMPKARAAASKALGIDDTLAEAHSSLGLIAENYDYDWKGAEKEFRRAIELNPDYATAHQWYAEFLAWQGRFSEAFAESERARQLDPISLIIATDHGTILYQTRQYDRAIEECRAILEMDPSFDHARALLAASYVEEGKFAEALREASKLTERAHKPHDSPWTWMDEAFIYGRWGRRVEADHALQRLEETVQEMPYGRQFALLRAYLSTGRNEQAIKLLQQLAAEQSHIVAPIKVDPMYDPLRADPRFQDLLRRIQLAE